MEASKTTTLINLQEALKKGRALLSLLSDSIKSSDNSNFAVDHQLSLCLQLCESFSHNINQQDTITLKDCSVVKAVVELVVRWGITPFLSPSLNLNEDTQQHVTDYNGVLLNSCETLLSYGLQGVHQCSHPFSVTLIVRNYYLPHIFAGLLQVAYGEEYALPSQKKAAVSGLENAMRVLPVGESVESLLTLLGHKHSDSRSPPRPHPAWFASKVGKLLSRLVMMHNGLTAVMQRLLGTGTKGDVMVYQRVATHLAKVPSSVATPEEYYKAVCPQILPFLVDRRNGKHESVEGDTAEQIIRNIHYTSVLLGCTIVVREPELSVIYLVRPMLLPLVEWSKSLLCILASHDQEKQRAVVKQHSELSIVESLLKMNSLLTAGHNNSNEVKRLILDETKAILPALLILHYLLETSPLSRPLWDISRNAKKTTSKKGCNQSEGACTSKNTSISTDKSKSFCKGFLDRPSVSEQETNDDISIIARLKSAFSDLMIAHINSSSEDVAKMMQDFLSLSKTDITMFVWPSKEGELWTILDPGHARMYTPARYLSKLLLALESWSLTVKLMGIILKEIIKFHKMVHRDIGGHLYESTSGGGLSLNVLEQLLESFEALNEVVGSKALKHDLSSACVLINDLLKEPSLSKDEDLAELMLHMVHSVVNAFNTRGCEEILDKSAIEVLVNTSKALENISLNFSAEKIKHMSSTLNARINLLLS